MSCTQCDAPDAVSISRWRQIVIQIGKRARFEARGARRHHTSSGGLTQKVKEDPSLLLRRPETESSNAARR